MTQFDPTEARRLLMAATEATWRAQAYRHAIKKVSDLEEGTAEEFSFRMIDSQLEHAIDVLMTIVSEDLPKLLNVEINHRNDEPSFTQCFEKCSARESGVGAQA